MTLPLNGTLDGVGVVVTRDEAPGGPLGTRLSALGAKVLHWPAVQIRPPANSGPLDERLGNLDEYDWIVFSSPRAVAAVAGRVRKVHGGPQVAAVGSTTAQALEAAGWRVDLVPTEGSGGQALVEAFAENRLSNGARVLFPASAIAGDVISASLTRLGAQVDFVVAYETVATSLDPSACMAQFKEGQVDGITFTSPSAVDGLMKCLGTEAFTEILSSVLVVVIGSTTGQALRDVGVTRFTIAETSTLDGLAQAVAHSILARSN